MPVAEELEYVPGFVVPDTIDRFRDHIDPVWIEEAWEAFGGQRSNGDRAGSAYPTVRLRGDGVAIAFLASPPVLSEVEGRSGRPVGVLIH
jgi:hypothetical protein